MGLTQNLGRLSPSIFTDSSLNIGIGAAPSGTYKFEVTGTAKISGVATFGSTLSNGTYSYTLPSATGTLALTSAIPANPVGGTGTTNYLSKFTGTSTIGNSLVYDNGTNVGVNQPSPTRTLDILGASGVGTVLKLQGASGTTTYLQMAYNGATNAQSGYIGYNSSSQMQFFTNDTVALTIDSNRNLGLGVTPSAWSGFKAIQVNNASLSGWSSDNTAMFLGANNYFDGTNFRYISSNFANQYRQQAGDHYWFNAPSGTAGAAITFTQAMTLTAAGSLGIGIATPVYKLQVVNSGNTLLQLNGNNTTGLVDTGFTISADDTKNIYLYQRENASLTIATNNVARIIIDASGNTSIGYTTNPSLYKLDVNGTGRFSGGAALSTAIFSNTGNDGGIDVINSGTLALGRTSQLRLANGTTYFGANDRSYQLVNIGMSSTAADFYIQYYNGTSYFDRFRIASTGEATFTGSVSTGRLNPYATDASPSLTTNVGMAVFESSSSVQLQMGGIAASPYTFWMQTKQSNNSGSSFPLALNPIGGNVLIGTTTDSGYKLDVNGTGRFSNAVNVFGANLAHAANKTTLSQEGSSNGAFWQSYGADASTKGKFTLRQYSSDASISAIPLSIDSTGAATFSSSVQANGNLLMYGNDITFYGSAPRIVSAGYSYPIKIDGSSVLLNSASGGNVLINKTSARGNEYLGIESGGNEFCNFQSTGGVRAFRVNNVDVEGFNTAGTAIFVGKLNSTGRSINAGGSINASGADYAEYMTKSTNDIIEKGDIVGIDSNGLLTNIYNNSISFAVKSTNPSYVGGDVWGDKIDDKTELEIARQKVDRIAFSGQVPCNVYNAKVGDYIIPIEINGKITGQAVTNPTFEQYQISVGKVWKIMEDGRAWIAVKIG